MLEGLVNLLKLDDEMINDQDYDMYDDEDQEEIITRKPKVVRPITDVTKSRGQLGESHSIVIARPTKLNDAKEIIDLLAKGNSVTINLEETDESIRQRVLDMVVGYSYFANCNVEQITTTIFIVSHGKISINE